MAHANQQRVGIAAWLLLGVSVVACCQSVYFDARSYGTWVLVRDLAGDLDALKDDVGTVCEQVVLVNGKLLSEAAERDKLAHATPP